MDQQRGQRGVGADGGCGIVADGGGGGDVFLAAEGAASRMEGANGLEGVAALWDLSGDRGRDD
uniref:Uncharacterized protein n=1 Tax=Oryza sativa subsp. japonica TaxID=39947 RepID=Q69M31_ORYSJ|nr:hypothetical protein [Oryza sativa Japonica Group]BAD36384.1 hypothetical protein [Oryza sativa Japonica Group]